ncbi:hypothetical protein Bca4012_075425 [Brassica carinata]
MEIPLQETNMHDWLRFQDNGDATTRDKMPYPYVVYYCHGHKSGARVFEVSLVTDDGRQRVVGPAVCHMNTSMWNADHVAFKVLKIEPRSAPVCHFFPLDNIVWLAN